MACELLAIDNLHANEKLQSGVIHIQWHLGSHVICRKANSAFRHFDNCVCLNQSLLSSFHEHMSRHSYAYDYVSFSMLI